MVDKEKGVEKRGFSTNKTLYKPLCLIILTVVIINLMAISMVSAFEFDNIQNVKETIGKAGYNDIEIKNAFGLGHTLWSGSLDYNDNKCETNCEAIQTITLHEDGSLIDEITFKTLQEDSSWIEEPIRNYNLQIKTGEQPYEVNDYEYQCNIIGQYGNGTDNEVCNNVKTGSHTEYTSEWQDYVLGTEMEANVYEIKLVGEKKLSRTVDWIYKVQGEELGSWAIWGAENNNVAYWNFDEGSGSLAVDSTGQGNNLTSDTSPNWGAGILNSAFATVPPDYFFNQTIVGDLVGLPISISVWINTTLFNDAVIYQGSDTATFSIVELSAQAGGIRGRFYDSDSGGDAGSNAEITIPNTDDEEWHHVVLTVNSTDMYMYWDGIFNQSISRAIGIKTNALPYELWVGAVRGGASKFYSGRIDEMLVTNDTLSPTEVAEIYNGGSPIGFGGDISITLNSPEDNFISPLEDIEFNATGNAGGGATLTNMSLWHNGTGVWHRNITNATLSLATETVLLNATFSDGTYLTGWELCDSDGSCGYSDNRTVSVDTIAPSLTINLPTALLGYGVSNGNETLNWSIIDINLDSIWYNYNGTNETVYGINNETQFQLDGTDFNLTIYANDSVGKINSSFIEWDYTIFEIAESHSDPVPEGSEQTFYINVTTGQASLTPFLIYNGTSYIGTFTQNGSEFYNERVLDIPPVSADTNVTFFWSFLMADTSIVNGTPENLTVTNFAMDNCTVNTIEIMNLLLKDEETALLLEGNTSNIEVEVDIFSLDGILIGEHSEQWVNNSNISICVGNLTGAEYNLYTTAEFSIDDYVSEFYFIDKKQINVSTVPININLMDLASADSTSFLFNFFDQDGLKVSNPIIHTHRKYIGEGLFREVERSKQNDDGNTIVHLVEEDVIYFFEVSQNDTVIFTSATYTALCDATPCTITLEESGGFQDFSNDWDLVDNGGYSISSNAVARTVNLTFETSTPSTFNLTVYKLDETGEYELVGSGQTTGTSGNIGVMVAQSQGNISFFGVVEQDSVYKKSQWIDFETEASDYFGTGLALFLGILIILCLSLMAISEGSGTIIFVILGMFLTVILGLIDYKTTIGLGLLVYFIITGGIIVWKLTRRNR